MFKSKFHLLLVVLFIAPFVYSQQSEKLVPKEASTVFSINNINLLKKISLDDLVKYDFMEEIHQELFDGSTSGKTLKDAGLDFEQRLNIFYGKDEHIEVSGFSFGIKDDSIFLSNQYFNKCRPNLPKPFIPTRIVII